MFPLNMVIFNSYICWFTRGYMRRTDMMGIRDVYPNIGLYGDMMGYDVSRGWYLVHRAVDGVFLFLPRSPVPPCALGSALVFRWCTCFDALNVRSSWWMTFHRTLIHPLRVLHRTVAITKRVFDSDRWRCKCDVCAVSDALARCAILC